MKSEALIWVFNDVGYVEQVTRREFRGGSMGMSFRVAKGVYVRPSQFRGRSVDSKSMERTDSGILGITTKHIYFAGSEKRFRGALGEDRLVRALPGRARNHAGLRACEAGGVHDGRVRLVVLGQHHRPRCWTWTRSRCPRATLPPWTILWRSPATMLMTMPMTQVPSSPARARRSSKQGCGQVARPSGRDTSAPTRTSATLF